MYTDGRNSFGGWMREIRITFEQIVGKKLAVYVYGFASANLIEFQ